MTALQFSAECESAQLTHERLAALFLIPHYQLHVFPDMAYVFPPEGTTSWEVENKDAPKNLKYKSSPFSKYEFYLNLRRMNSVNGTAKDLYMLANGLRTAEDIYAALITKHRQPYGTMKQKIYDFMTEMVARTHVQVSEVPVEVHHLHTGSEEFYYPPHLSIEVTSMCNIACLHCYGSFEQARFDAINADKLISWMEQMKKAGFASVELTGGECTTHPDFPRILRWCCENLHMIAVLTNAVNIREEIFNIIIKHRDKVLVQICINGNEEYHAKFTKSTIAYRCAMKAVERLARAGVFVRTPMNVTFENVDQIEETLEAVMNAGSSSFATNFVDYGYGRAMELADDERGGEAGNAELPNGQPNPDGSVRCERVSHEGLTCQDRLTQRKKALEKLKELEKRYPNFVISTIQGAIKEQMDWERSCGAGRRSVYVASNGRIGLCPMSVETGIPGFGDLKFDDMSSVMGQEFAKHISTVPAPNDNDCIAPDGANCPHQLEHRGCILHGIMQYMKTPHTCWWGQKYNVQKLIDSGSHTLTKNADGSWNLPELSHKGTGCGCASSSKGSSLVELQAAF